MLILRRNILKLIAGARLASRLSARPYQFEVDRLAGQCPARGVNVLRRHYRVSATVTLLSFRIVTRADVGSGFAIIEEANGSDANLVAIQFGAGSLPANSRGLNRLGFIQEVVVERPRGQVEESAYFGFMTTSAEKTVDQAQTNLAAVGAAVPYVAAEAVGRNGQFDSRLYRISLPSQLTWQDYAALAEKVRTEMIAGLPTQSIGKKLPPDQSMPVTFLYAIRKALLAPDTRTTQSIVYNGRTYTLRTARKRDAAAGARFFQRKLVRDAGQVARMDATLCEDGTDRVTPFKIWLESGCGQTLPVCFEYQAKSFLRLTFEFDPNAQSPHVGLALNKIHTAKDKN